MKEVAMRVQQLRMDRHLAQKEVAAVLGISQPAYSDKENGHTAFTAVELDKLAEFHRKTLDELLHADRSVLNMREHASHGYIDNVIHALNVHGTSEELIKQFLEALAANTRVLERISAQQERVLELLSKR
ncbi:MAG: helix-turn-helix transcriptional regulator [Bacteroidetes bacterium]|nr:helix-turn-helix transcriptional regulator [Bacteroidota bacterium]